MNAVPPKTPLRIAIIGAGPAGIYAADALTKSDTAENTPIQIDIFDKMPTPFGLIRYGVAPDHPRIKTIITALHRIMEKPEIRFFGNVDFGKDIKLEELQTYYQAVIFATGAFFDKDLAIPGIELENSFGAADFVAWYDANPDFPREWDLSAEKVAILGVGNVGLDISRVLAKTAEELLVTEIPEHVHAGLKTNQAKEIHVFGRRGPAQAKFTPLELKELNQSPNIDVIVSPEDIDYDEASINARRNSKIVDQISNILEQYAINEPKGAPHKIIIHFFESPVEVLGSDGKVTGLRTERMEYDGQGGLKSTGKTNDWPVEAVYRAIGYKSVPVEEIPFNPETNTIPHEGGRVLNTDGTAVPSLYATGWIKRGPVGLIGSTKGDANETVENLLTDYNEGILSSPQNPDLTAVDNWLQDKDINYTTWDGWLNLDNHEKSLGEKQSRDRIKVVEREDMVDIANKKIKD